MIFYSLHDFKWLYSLPLYGCAIIYSTRSSQCSCSQLSQHTHSTAVNVLVARSVRVYILFSRLGHIPRSTRWRLRGQDFKTVGVHGHIAPHQLYWLHSYQCQPLSDTPVSSSGMLASLISRNIFSSIYKFFFHFIRKGNVFSFSNHVFFCDTHLPVFLTCFSITLYVCMCTCLHTPHMLRMLIQL